MFLIAVTFAAACGKFDPCKTDDDCNYSGNPCLKCAAEGYCVLPDPPATPTPGTPTRWDAWLGSNVGTPSGMPLSYQVYPQGYFAGIPDADKSKPFSNATFEPQCGDVWVSAEAMNNYTFQTEEMITVAGTNLYDAAMWSIARCLSGHCVDAQRYISTVLIAGKTQQLADIHGDAPCHGVIAWGECSDPHQSGACGLCYGDGADKTAPTSASLYFRIIADWYSYEGTKDARCPERQPWIWNDWKPILGENAWAQGLGPLHVARIAAGGGLADVPDSDPVFTLASSLINVAKRLEIAGVGGVYFAPRNMYYSLNQDAGSSASVENNASLYAALRAILALLRAKGPSSQWASLIPDVTALMDGIESFLRASYSPSMGYFRQGGFRNHTTGAWDWEQGAHIPTFAVDCQTWTMTALGPLVVDEWFGAGTHRTIWETTKTLAGYKPQADGTVMGVGFSNGTHDVFSGEWTLGAVGYLRVVANMTGAAWATAEAAQMAAAVAAELAVTTDKGDTVQYANRRWYIPFGWWANPLPSMASTAWASATDLQYNPFHPLGLYTSDV